MTEMSYEGSTFDDFLAGDVGGVVVVVHVDGGGDVVDAVVVVAVVVAAVGVAETVTAETVDVDGVADGLVAVVTIAVAAIAIAVGVGGEWDVDEGVDGSEVKDAGGVA
jgi:hypothetical protein